MSEDIIPYDEARGIWQRIARTEKDVAFPGGMELHRKFMNIFQVGKYYHYIFNCITGTLEYVDESVKEVLGYTPDEFTLENLLSIIHPDDMPYFLNFENEVTAFFGRLTPAQVMKYKVRYDYRIRNIHGDYVRILQQVVTIHADDCGAVLRTMGVHTDITHLKREGEPQLSFIGLEGEPSYNNVEVKKAYNSNKELLTRREKQILAYMAQGYRSADISTVLYISKQTVVTHRRNMLYKTGASTAAELVMTALREGWL